MLQYGIPEVFEHDATGIVKDVYEDIKYVLKVPIVNFIFRALANYPEFLSIAWQQVRPSMLTLNVETAAQQLRYPTNQTKIPTYHFQKEYQPHELQRIKSILATFQYVNPKLLLIASAWSESLGNRPIKPKKEITGYIQPGVFQTMPSIELVHIPQAPHYLKQILLDIAKEHHSFDVASDYRALARYPRFLQITWNELKSFIGSDEYILLRSRLLKQSVSIAHKEMPYSVTVNGDQLRSIYSPSQIAGLMGLVLLFQRFLPGLIIENEFMRRMLSADS